MKIVEMETIALCAFGTPPPKGVGNVLVTPMSILERPPAPAAAATAAVGSSLYALIVALTVEDGITGYGTVALATGGSVYTLEHTLKPLVLGADPFDTNLLWETMYRTTLNHGRKGLVLNTISAVDIALWDLKGACSASRSTTCWAGACARRSPCTPAASTRPRIWTRSPPRRPATSARASRR
jgi:L-alanine-DL-glutamate epimerase-like enolase superfamily enzyme